MIGVRNDTKNRKNNKRKRNCSLKTSNITSSSIQYYRYIEKKNFLGPTGIRINPAKIAKTCNRIRFS